MRALRDYEVEDIKETGLDEFRVIFVSEQGEKIREYDSGWYLFEDSEGCLSMKGSNEVADFLNAHGRSDYFEAFFRDFDPLDD